ncbi:MAG: hypothetical protein LM587_01280 [Candidatus Aenigmarchaeota archaeon]|nr:hypothetical protein [Candidatus Aenigmarchaeota archaeon]
MKGIVPVIIGGVIFIISGIVFLIFSLHIGFVGLTKFLDILKELLWLFFRKPAFSPVEKAFLCYYYICKGDISNIEEYCRKGMGELAYAEVYTLPKVLGVKDLQCRPELMLQFPLEVRLNENAEIDYERIKSALPINAYLILASNDEYKEDIKWLPSPTDHVVHFYISRNAVFDAKKKTQRECGFEWGLGPAVLSVWLATIENAVEHAIIKNGTYYISPLLTGKYREYERWLEELQLLPRTGTPADYVEFGLEIIAKSFMWLGEKIAEFILDWAAKTCTPVYEKPNYGLLLSTSYGYLNLTEDKWEFRTLLAGSYLRVRIVDEIPKKSKGPEGVTLYNYMLKMSKFDWSSGEKKGVGVTIEFWNSTKRNKEDIFCDISGDCWKGVTFKTREGNLTIYVFKIREGKYIDFDATYWRKNPPVWEDPYKYQFCGGSLEFCYYPLFVAPSSPVTISFCGLLQCGGKRIYLKNNTCDTPDSESLITSCEIPLGGVGCSVSFTAPSVNGIYTYYGCIDKNGDGDFDDEDESVNTDLEVCKPVGYECQKDEECCSRKCSEVEGEKICVIPT